MESETKRPGSPIVVVDTQEAEDVNQMMDIFQVYLDFGFEGLMIRNAAGLYKNKRSYDLQKVKTFVDSEFKVIDIDEGKGKMEGKAMFTCETPEGKTFRVKMVGALDDLIAYLINKDDYIGQHLTVKYQGLTSDGIPRFPVAIRFREDV